MHPYQDTRQLAAMAIYAADLALAYPQAPAHAIADKLLTVFADTDRGVRLTVAITACNAATSTLAA